MASTYVSFYMKHPAFGGRIQHGLSTMDLGSNVTVSIVQGKITNGYPANGARFNWTMYLQRRVNGSWTTIGTRTGYVQYGSESHRIFTDVLKKGQMTRVKVDFGSHIQFSNEWKR